jgi:hypothetical protein
MSTIDFLDKNVQIPMTSESPFFESMCRMWDQRDLVVDMMKREAVERARYAFQVAQQMTQPTFTPAVVIADTSSFEAINETDTGKLEQIWADENVYPVALLDKRPPRFFARIGRRIVLAMVRRGLFK